MDTQGILDDGYLVALRSLVFIRCGRQVLLLRRAPDRAIWPGVYNGIGGHVRPGERLVESARRETLEETGLVVDRLHLAGLVHVTDRAATRGVLVVVFTAETTETTVRPSDEGELHWVELGNALTLDLVPDLVHILPRLSWDAAAAPFVVRVTAALGALDVQDDPAC
jgi:8-oxo-dGTP diphosphatase